MAVSTFITLTAVLTTGFAQLLSSIFNLQSKNEGSPRFFARACRATPRGCRLGRHDKKGVAGVVKSAAGGEKCGGGVGVRIGAMVRR